MKIFLKVSLFFLGVLCLVFVLDRAYAQDETMQIQITKEDMGSLNKMLESLDAIVEHLDAIIESAKRQSIAVAEARAVLKLHVEELKKVHAAKVSQPSSPSQVMVAGYTEVPAGILILGGKKLIEATEILLDRGIKEVEKNNKDIENRLKIQKEERKSIERRIPPKRK